MISKIIKDCLKKFSKRKIKDIEKLAIGSFKNWDSLAHLNLLMSIEKKLKIKFTIDEMTSLKNINQIIKVIKMKFHHIGIFAKDIHEKR